MAAIKLNTPLRFVKKAEESVNLTSVTFMRTVDIPAKKVIAAWVAEIQQGPVVLWQGAEYDQPPASSWTNNDVMAKLQAVLEAGNPQIWKGK